LPLLSRCLARRIVVSQDADESVQAITVKKAERFAAVRPASLQLTRPGASIS